MSWINYHHLYYFWVIVKEGGIAKAAKRLRLGQPTLSTQLRKLEEAWSRQLFERRNRRLILTEAGRVVFDYAEEIFRLGSEMQDALSDRAESHRLRVQIGVADDLPKSIAADLAKAAYAAGDCMVSLFEGNADFLEKEMLAYRLDFFITNTAPASLDSRRVQARSLGRFPVAVFAAKNLASLKKSFPRSLQGQNFILPTRHSRLRFDLDHFFQAQDLRISVRAEVQDCSLQLELGARGYGLVPMSVRAADFFVRQGLLFNLGTLEGIYEDVWLVAGVRKVANPVANQIWKSFKMT